MKSENIKKAKQAAELFLSRVREFEDAEKKKRGYSNTKESGALRRQSMELTRSLAEMRKHKRYE